jgi:uncharacterized repeat protein (TIGR01451 family)
VERLEDRIAPSIVTPFKVRFTVNAPGDTVILGNTLMTASTVGNPGRTQQDVINAQNGTGSFINNNDWNMVYVDVDNNPTTFNSSSCSLNLVNGANVLFAALYWMGNSSSAQRSQVLFSTPASGGYVTLNGAIIGDSSAVTPAPNPPGPNYEGFADVTSLVRAAGNGSYTVANVQATTGSNFYAGWSMIVVFGAPGLPPRNLTVFDGYAIQANGNPPLTIPISGFIAPPAGVVNSKVSVVAAEGDLGLTGDSMQMNGTTLSNVLNPATNFFNSTISNIGVPVTAKTPNFTNQLGFDADSVQVPSGVIANSATSATLTFTTTGDTYFPGAVATTIDLYAPNIVATKTVADLTGGNSLPGDTLEYTINLTNNGQDPAGNVILTDPIPTNTVYVPGSLRILTGANAGVKTDVAGDDQASFDAAHNQVIFNLGSGATATAGGTLGIGATTSIRFRVQIDPGVAANTVILNQADVKYTGVTTGFPFDSLSTVPAITVDNSIADIAVAKTVSNPTPNVGDSITFTVTVTNNGPGPGTGITITDLLPSGLQLTNAITSQGQYSGATGLWTVGSLANGGAATLTIIATVLGPTPQTNTATISHTDSVDPNSANNQASATETPLLADLAVTKAVSNPRPNVGDTITYTVSLTNNGPNNATNVTVTDQLPAGLTFVSSSAGAAYDSTTGLWTVGNLANGAIAVLTITAIVSSPQAILNVASISHADQFDPDTNNNSASILETPQQADLAVSKTVDNPTPNVGAIITYTITLVDNGPDPATGITVQDNLPAGVTFLSSTASQGSYDPNTGVWTVGDITALTIGTPKVLTITGQVTSLNVQPNTATITHADQFDPNLANNTATSPISPQQADVSVSKIVNDPTPNVGEVVTFTLTIRDNGPSVATNVLATDLLPAGLIFVSATPSQGTYNSGTGVWTVGTVDTTTPQTLQIQAQVNSPNVQTNTASVTADQPDPNPNNNMDNATVTPQQADLSLGKVVDNPTPNVGDTVTFTVTLADNGPNPATNVVVNDPLPAGLTLISATPSQGTYSGGVWTVGTVNPTLAQTLTITAQVVSPSAQTNIASITHSDQFDPDPTNNQSSATETPQQADLSVKKVVDRFTPNVGDPIVYTVTLTNNGPNNATNVQLNDLLPTGVTFAFSTPSQGTYDPATGVWDVGTVANGAMAILQIHGQLVSPNPQLNVVDITQSDQFDPNLGNNTSSALITPQQADLQVSKTVSNPTPNVGDIITYTIVLANNGPNSATTVTLNDQLPSDVSFVSSTPSVGTYDPTTGVWTVGTVDPGTPQTLTITAQVISPVTEVNTASVGHSDVFDPNPANNSASAFINPQEADLALFKSVDNATPNVGDTITYTLTLADTGPSAATNVEVTDLLPAGLNFVGATPSQGTYNSTTGVWTVGTVTVATPQTLTIMALVTGPNPETNSADITHSDQFDPNTNNNMGSATITPQQADLAVSKSVDNATPNVGDTVTFTINVTDIGPNIATNVSVNDLLPAGLTFVAAAPSQGTYDNVSGVWTVGTVDTAAPAQLLLRATVSSPQPQTNTAAIGHSDQFDPEPLNNQADATVTPQQSDLVVGKSVSNPTPNVGDTITFTVTVANDGPNIATNVTLQDILPPQVSFQSSLASQGSYDSTTNTWTVGSVGVGATQTLTITVLVTSPNPQANTASISHSDQFDPDTANNSDTASIDPLQADLLLTKFVNDPTPNVGDTVNFTINLTNNGPSSATNVMVTDPLPAGLTFVSATPSVGSYDALTGIWTVGTIASGTQTLQIMATVVSPTAETNTATATAREFDPDPGNNSASATVTPQQADLQVQKTVDQSQPSVGDVITYDIKVKNAGPDDATAVQLTDSLPSGLAFVSATPTLGSYDPVTGLWDLGILANNVVADLQIQARVVSSQAQTNTAAVSHADQFDPDTANNSASATIGPLDADIALMKQVNPTSAFVGTDVTYTFVLHNSGPGVAANTTVTDPFPAGVTFVSAAPPTQGSFDSTTGVWTVGDLANGATALLQVVALVNQAGPITNNATAATQSFDPDLANNVGSATTLGLSDFSKRSLLASSVADPAPSIAEVQADLKWLSASYHDLLSRAADTGGLLYWTGALIQGMSRQSAIDAIQSSTEYRANQVEALYHHYLHRSSDSSGLSADVAFLKSGGTVEQLASSIAASAEYFQSKGGTNSQFLAAVYQDALGRSIDSSGAASWGALLAQGVSRSQVAFDIFSSVEYDQHVVNRLYNTLLNRLADSGSATWVNAMLQGTRDETIIAAIMGSDEFFQLAN